MKKLILVCTALLLSFTIMGLVGCGEDLDEEMEKSSKGPSISYLVPKNGAKDVPTTTAFVITFNRDIVTPSAANLTFTPGVSGTVSYDADTRTLVFKPSSALSKYADYSMEVTGITDVEGNAMLPVTVNFKTSLADARRPEIISTYPGNRQKDLGHDTKIILRFSEPVDRTKFWDSISLDPRVGLSSDTWALEWGSGDDEEVTIFPPPGADPFEVNKEYALKIAKDNVVDLSDNHMFLDYELRFHTLRYAVEKAVSPGVGTTNLDPVWIFTVGKRGGTWVVVWGGERPQGAPAGNNPGGTITASADGHIFDDVDTHATRKNEKVTYSVSSGDGNRLTFSSQNLNGKNSFRVIFGSSSSYLTFSLRPVTSQYINIGTKLEHPSRSPFILPNK